MAELVLSAFFTVLFEKLASEALKKFARSKGIDSLLKKLKRSLIQIKALLNDASRKEIRDEAVKEWLNGLQDLAYDIDDLLDDLATKAMHRELIEESGATTSMVRKLISTSSTKFSLSRRIHGKLDDITARLQELVEEKNNLGLCVNGESPEHMNRRLETSLVDASRVIGREGDREALRHKLLRDEPSDRNFSIVPIVGMGGVGKTTLARLLYDEMLGKDHFELKAWVCVSDEFNIFNISKTIFQSVGGGNQEFSDLNLLQVALKEKISKKRFLLVLDDVWSESYTDWEILERPLLAGALGSKVIITTRKQSLLTQMGYNQPYSLSVLSHDDAVSLFCQHSLAENNFDSHLALKPYGEGIVAKCDGLPLALIALGRLLRTKTEEEEWKEVLNSDIWRLGTRDEIVPALRLSYHDLSASLKQLFAYCSLFPKDYEFEKLELILLWMAEGFLHQSSSGKSMHRLGLECFEELLSRSFFQHAPTDKSVFVMHDLMNDLATSVAGDFFSRLDIKTKKELRKGGMEKHRHFSFVCEKYMVCERFKAYKGAKNLRTFLAVSVPDKSSWQIFNLSYKILAELLRELPLLRVLSLSQLNISEVPEFIGSMKHLRYLNLAGTRITHLPENICNLYNLQTLIVFGCQNLIKLPKSFSKLKNLQHLDLRHTPDLKKMPLGIGELKGLRILSKVIIGGDNGFSLTELKDLKDLQGSLGIGGMEKVRSAMHAQEANLSQMRLRKLVLEWSDVFDGSRNRTLEKEVLNVLKPCNDNLEELAIMYYGGINFPNWVGDPWFLWLTNVTLRGCEKCTSLPPFGLLPSLKALFIIGMDEVKVVGSEFLGTGLAFQSLEILHFEDMQGWEVWSTNSGDGHTLFPCLEVLRLKNCPKLVKISLEALPSLKVLEIEICGHGVVRSVVPLSSSVTKLDISDISVLNDQLWGGVIQYLGAVERLRIRHNNEIRYLWESESEASKVLVKLRKVVVRECSQLVSLGEKEEDNCGSNLASLSILKVSSCNSLERCTCPNSIESLEISDCDSLTSVSFPTGGGQKLKSVVIKNCEQLLEKKLGGGEKAGVLINSNMRMLESVNITNWTNLKSVIELSCFIHLNTLYITNCPNIESFPDIELSNLALLQVLVIEDCPSMDASFPRGLWPPKLRSLGIGGLQKSISEWGPQNLPTSLVNLVLRGRGSEDVISFSQLSHLLPSSLTFLHIHEFDKLESISMGLRHLTSLQEILITICPKTKDLPETLLPTLLRLTICECPNLKKKISRRGSYWPLISHIPCIEILDNDKQYIP